MSAPRRGDALPEEDQDAMIPRPDPTAPTSAVQAPEAPKTPTTTTYIVMRRGLDDEGEVVWLPIGGHITVPAGRVDKAYAFVLESLSADFPEAESFTLAAVSVRSWKVEKFELEPPAAPRFKAV